MYKTVFKRIFDLSAALLLSLLSLPIFLILYPAVKITSPGPFLFRQIRIGKNSQAFSLFKIRSMKHDPDNQGPYFTTSRDSRISPLGYFIRKTSLDELPQLWNVLNGDMSLIGPRPDVPEQQALYTPEEWQTRHLVRPGITGLAQSSLRSSATAQQRKSLDLHYVRNISLKLDIRIVFLTLRILFKKGVQN